MKDKLYTIGMYILSIIIVIFIAIGIIILIPIFAIGISLFIIASILLTLIYIPIYFTYKLIELIYRSIIIYSKMIFLNIKYKILKRKKE